MKFFERNLYNFYKKFGRKGLPWRKKCITPYEVWVSEIMLQQTQVSRVMKYYNKFLRGFPDIFSLAKSSWKEFLTYYRGLGYYRRGENMLKTAKIIVNDYHGVFPKNKKLLMSLPGIGEYTVAAILSFAYNKNIIAYDTNAQRVYGRFFYGSKNALLKKIKLEKGIKMNKKMLNASVMDFANTVCLKKPLCTICPLMSKCRYCGERGKGEERIHTQLSKFPTASAQVYLWLHKEHKIYYSLNPKKFEVFVLPPLFNNRKKIKEYFKKKFKLSIAVRPPHKKVYINGVPTLFINAQILLGKHSFGVFTKEDLV